MGLLQPGSLPRWHHSSIAVEDIDKAVAFHRRAFGFEVTFEVRGMNDQIESLLGLPGVRCDLVQGWTATAGQLLEFIAFFDLPAECDPRLPVRPGQGHLAYVVEDLLEMLTMVTAAGAQQIGTVTEFAEGPAVYCWMPAGGVIELEQHHLKD